MNNNTTKGSVGMTIAGATAGVGTGILLGEGCAALNVACPVVVVIGGGGYLIYDAFHGFRGIKSLHASAVASMVRIFEGVGTFSDGFGLGIFSSGFSGVFRSIGTKEAFSVANRVAELRATIPVAQQGRITMGVGLAEDANGVKQILIATSEPRGYLRPGVTLKSGEILVKGTGHAEVDIVNYTLQNNLKLLEIGATRPICSQCFSVIDSIDAATVTPLK